MPARVRRVLLTRCCSSGRSRRPHLGGRGAGPAHSRGERRSRGRGRFRRSPRAAPGCNAGLWTLDLRHAACKASTALGKRRPYVDRISRRPRPNRATVCSYSRSSRAMRARPRVAEHLAPHHAGDCRSRRSALRSQSSRCFSSQTTCSTGTIRDPAVLAFDVLDPTVELEQVATDPEIDGSPAVALPNDVLGLRLADVQRQHHRP